MLLMLAWPAKKTLLLSETTFEKDEPPSPIRFFLLMKTSMFSEATFQSCFMYIILIPYFVGLLFKGSNEQFS